MMLELNSSHSFKTKMTRSLGYLALLLMASPCAMAQTRYTSQPTERALAGFGASFLIDGQEILVSRSGLSAMFPEPPNQTGALMV